MAKIKRNHGRGAYTFFKELGGAPDRATLSKTARVLIDRRLVRGRVLDYGCGKGFDAKNQGWEAYDPYYRPVEPSGLYDTIIVNHVANILTRDSRAQLLRRVSALLGDGSMAYLSVARNIPVAGKHGSRRRIHNYVVLTLPSVYVDDEEEIYCLLKGSAYEDRTREFEQRA